MVATLRRLATALVVTALVGYTTLAHGAAAFKIVTASERGTYIQIGQDLARYIAPLSDIQLDALPSAGSAENVRRLRYEPGVKLALVQSDVYQAFIDQAAAGNAQARSLIEPLRVIMPLYNEEIYFVVRADSPLNYVHDILEHGTSADRQLQVYKETGDLRAVVRWLIAETRAGHQNSVTHQ